MRATRCVAELRPGRSITKVVSARAAQSPPAHPPHAATKPNIVRPVLRALPRRAGAATTYPEPTSASSSTSSSRENAAEALSALLSGGSGVLVASTAITSLHPLPTCVPTHPSYSRHRVDLRKGRGRFPARGASESNWASGWGLRYTSRAAALS
jgi:hypothetical protein